MTDICFFGSSNNAYLLGYVGDTTEEVAGNLLSFALRIDAESHDWDHTQYASWYSTVGGNGLMHVGDAGTDFMFLARIQTTSGYDATTSEIPIAKFDTSMTMV
jgi:hypothetical protein